MEWQRRRCCSPPWLVLLFRSNQQNGVCMFRLKSTFDLELFAHVFVASSVARSAQKGTTKMYSNVVSKLEVAFCCGSGRFG
jgi:hypothetical protein